MEKKGFHFRFNKQERSGIFFLLLIIFILQGIFFYIKAKPFNGNKRIAINTDAQSRLDSLKQESQISALKIFPFNPNYITDHKGYVLGMSSKELDKLFAFRAKGRFVNSAQEFQQVTQVSDSLLETMSPYFKFPNWDKKDDSKKHFHPIEEKPVEVTDLNRATPEELMDVNGIGPKLSQRIVKFRDRLGGFLVTEQLYDVYGLEPEVVQRAMERFQVHQPPAVKKISINTATVEELSKLVYITTDMAHAIVRYREENGAFGALDELSNLKVLPAERIGRIKLYLTL
ncbi:helix-hairpin-helix domain-containing protein [Flagellimonas alvinocaridis]|uniref:Helix-hairpin-helix domain-containing protein n=1 Tax=Flagellimonas alvinocaridis TaxID=2530200 RepID=A0A4S8RM11_9FLAO|nr:helix-hairpin-helix domain-containing protein [Allomuricauda alvinocaridis]THV59090.1 helix-hairpin-helix domain-containing protein [Allomuricauda alvinocaridis]